MDNLIDSTYNPNAMDFLKNLREEGFCGDGSLVDDYLGIQKYNIAIRAKYEFDFVKQDSERKAVRSDVSKLSRAGTSIFMNKCKIESEKYYNILTLSQQHFIDKMIKVCVSSDGSGKMHRLLGHDYPLTNEFNYIYGQNGFKRKVDASVHYMISNKYDFFCEYIKQQKQIISVHNKRIEQLEHSNINVLQNNEEINEQIKSHIDLMTIYNIRIEQLENSNTCIIQNNEKTNEQIKSHKDLMTIQNKRIDELESKLFQIFLTFKVMIFLGFFVGIVYTYVFSLSYIQRCKPKINLLLLDSN